MKAKYSHTLKRKKNTKEETILISHVIKNGTHIHYLEETGR